MTTKDRMLAEAWRDLAGWHVGMVTLLKNVVWSVEPDGWVHLSNTANVAGSTLVPALDSPSNWGHWLAWMVELADAYPALSALSRAAATAELPHQLMRGYVEWRLCWAEPKLPASVLAWWKEVAEW